MESLEVYNDVGLNLADEAGHPSELQMTWVALVLSTPADLWLLEAGLESDQALHRLISADLMSIWSSLNGALTLKMEKIANWKQSQCN